MTNAPTILLSRTASALAGLSRRVEVPRALGSVVLIKPLGEGGMSVVHLARHEILQKNVAVKFLLDIPASADDPRFTAFIEGARAAAAIRHPGLNVVHHADAVEGVPYLVMELIDGPTIADVLRHRGPMPLNIARTVIEHTCAAVGELHDHGIIHRDIKPANVMVDPAGRVVVTDFGLAMQRPASLFGGSSGGLAGTPTYMAPEMFDANVSTRSDVYAIGVMMFELLAGKPAFVGDFHELRNAHRSARFPVAPLADQRVPESVITLIERAMHKETLYRPKSARHVLDALIKACDAAGIARASDAQVQRYVESPISSAAQTQNTPTPAYYDRLNTLAGIKRRTPDGTFVSAPAPEPTPRPAPTPSVEPSPQAAVPATPESNRAAPSVSATKPRFPGVALRLIVPIMTVLGSLVIVLAYAAGSLANTAAAAALLALAVIGVWAIFIREFASRPLRDGVTRCGWCGGTLRSLRDLRCTECGKFINVAPAKKDRPVAYRWLTRVQHHAMAAAAFLSVLAVWAPLCAKWIGAPAHLFSIPGIAYLLAIAIPATLASLIILALFATSSARLTGRTRCGSCGADFEGATTPDCAGCGTRL